MSRSYKKHGWCHYTKKHSDWKRIYNRQLRRVPIDFIEGVSTLADGGAYRRANNPWNICDYEGLAPSFDECWWCDSLFEYRKLYYAK